MGQCFEIYRITTEARSRTGSTFSDSFILTEEAQSRLSEILSAFGDNCFRFMIGLNKSFNELNCFPWAGIVFQKEYHLRGYVVTTRAAYTDILMGGHARPLSSSPENRATLPFSTLFIRDKRAFSQLVFQSPLYASFHDLLVDKDPDRYWMCFPDPLPEEWVRERESEDRALYEWFTEHNQTS